MTSLTMGSRPEWWTPTPRCSMGSTPRTWARSRSSWASTSTALSKMPCTSRFSASLFRSIPSIWLASSSHSRLLKLKMITCMRLATSLHACPVYHRAAFDSAGKVVVDAASCSTSGVLFGRALLYIRQICLKGEGR